MINELEAILETVSKIRSYEFVDSTFDYLDFIESACHDIEQRYVKLPVDKDGEVIHLGDVMVDESPHHPDAPDTFTVYRIGYDEKWTFIGGGLGSHHPEECRHYRHKPTVDELLIEFLEEAMTPNTEPNSIVDKYSTKLRLKEDSE